MWQRSTYIFGYPQGESPIEAYYRREYEAFLGFMGKAIGPENME